MQLITRIHQQKMPMIMGILNLATDSFATEGHCLTVDSALRHVEKIIEDGVDIIDIGAEPTNPKQANFKINATDELKLLLPVIESIKRRFDVPLSVDTSDAIVMKEVVAAGVDMINDVRAFRKPNALETVAKLDVPVCLMHMQYPEGLPENFTLQKENKFIIDEIEQFLKVRLDEVITAGVRPENIILDPGIGAGSFGKSTIDNLRILKAIPRLKALGFPLLIGLSRKTFIGDLLNCPEHERVYASLALNCVAATKGAAIIRTHDVRALHDSLIVLQALEEIEDE